MKWVPEMPLNRPGDSTDPMSFHHQECEEKKLLSLLPSSRATLLFPIFMGCFGVLSRSDPTERKRENTGEGTFAFSYNPYFSIISSYPSIFLSSLSFLVHISFGILVPSGYFVFLFSGLFLLFLFVFLWLSFEYRKMMKKKIRVSKEPSLASTSYFSVGEEARARLKYHSLLQDYQELLKETNEKRERLEKILQKKSQLLAEVKFLRRKFQQFSTTSTAQFKLKKQSHICSSPSDHIAQSKNPAFQTKLPLKSRSQKVKEMHVPISTPLLDLNQTAEEMEVFDVEQKPLNVDRLKRFSREGGDVLANDSMLSICRDTGIGSNKRAGKRKVSWQDQLTLRV